jgi:hypothetical protein
MFEEFSPRFESTFRTIFILWVVGWAFINGFDVLRQYAEFGYSSGGSDAALIIWFFRLITSVLALTLGIVLLFWSSNVPNRIKKLRPISNIPLFTGLTVLYYLFPTVAKIVIDTAAATNETFLRTFIFNSAWLFPSIIILVFHLLYYLNIGKYNETLEESQK